LAFGDLIAGALLQTGRFTHTDAQYVWGILAGSAVGLLASTMGRLYSSAYYALRDTRTPLKFAVLRVVLTTGLGYVCAKPLPIWIGIDPRWGVAGLTASAGIAGWVEFALLRRGMHRKLDAAITVSGFVAKLWIAAAIAVAVGSAGRWTPFAAHPIYGAVATLGPFSIIYLALGSWIAPEGRRLLMRFTKLPGRNKH
ncbi:MAG TPA: lipid II flippase MurJ, partial [Bryobacteraceae bacterium]|nr:lipid II flippase MurJ [Bryobacteraceae bacterium]